MAVPFKILVAPCPPTCDVSVFKLAVLGWALWYGRWSRCLQSLLPTSVSAWVLHSALLFQPRVDVLAREHMMASSVGGSPPTGQDPESLAPGCGLDQHSPGSYTLADCASGGNIFVSLSLSSLPFKDKNLEIFDTLWRTCIELCTNF